MRNQLRPLLGLFCLSISFSAAAAIPPAEKLLPDDTLLVVTAPDFTKLREAYRHSPQSQFWNDPSMQPFRDNFMSKMREQLLRPLERDLGIKLDDYTNLPQGQITFAITQNAAPGAQSDQPLALLLLIDARDKSAQLKKNLASLRKSWTDSGKLVRSEKIRDTDFSIVPVSQKDIPKTLRQFSSAPPGAWTGDDTNSKTEWVIGQFDSLLIAGNSTRAVEKVVAHLTGTALPSLGDLAGYDANRLALFRDAPLYGWMNVKALMDYLSHGTSETNLPEDPFGNFRRDKILEATGLGSVRTVAVSAQTAADGSLVRVFIGVPDSSRQGIFKLLPGGEKDASPPPFVPADAVKFQRCRLDGQKAWATLETIAGDIYPQITAGINSFFALANSMSTEKDFDLKKNLIGNLGDDIIDYEKAPQGNKLADLNSPPTLVLIGSPHPEQLAGALKSVLAFVSQGGPPREREFLGRKIFSVPLPERRTTPDGTPAPAPTRSLSYAASGGYLALSTDAPILEEYLRSADSQQKTLRETPGLNDAIARVGGASSGWLGFENEAETTRALFEALRKNTSTNSSASAVIPGGGALPGMQNIFKNWMDYTLLPPFDSISNNFYFTVNACGSDVDGITFKMFAPTPPALRK